MKTGMTIDFGEHVGEIEIEAYHVNKKVGGEVQLNFDLSGLDYADITPAQARELATKVDLLAKYLRDAADFAENGAPVHPQPAPLFEGSDQ